MNTLSKGDLAPSFTLLNQHDQPISLTNALTRGPVLVYFYPRALTPGCTVQARGLQQSQSQLADFDVTVLGISPDPVAKLARFATKHQIEFSFLSDEDHQVADDFGVWGEKKFMGKTYQGIHRISFVIAQDGTVAHVFDKFKTRDHHQVVLDYFDQNKA